MSRKPSDKSHRNSQPSDVESVRRNINNFRKELAESEECLIDRAEHGDKEASKALMTRVAYRLLRLHEDDPAICWLANNLLFVAPEYSDAPDLISPPPDANQALNLTRYGDKGGPREKYDRPALAALFFLLTKHQGLGKTKAYEEINHHIGASIRSVRKDVNHDFSYYEHKPKSFLTKIALPYFHKLNLDPRKI